MMTDQDLSKTVPAKKKKKQPFWLIYVALLLAGILLLADAYNFTQLARWTARLGIALVFSAIALTVGNGRTVGYVATAIIWAAVVISYFV
jgi:hypothetical protein